MISIVIPCYNEAKIIRQNIKILTAATATLNEDHEIILVNDGSSDQTLSELNASANIYNDIKVVSYLDNKGKGYAVKQGFLKAEGDIIIFMDADLSTDLSALKEIAAVYHEKITPFIIIGSRKKKGSVITIKQPLKRRILSNCCTNAVNLILGLNVTDSQCGFKAFDKNTAKYLAENQKIYGWVFDIEYLYMAKKKNIPIDEMNVKWTNLDRSNVRPIHDAIKSTKDLIKIKQLHKNDN